MKITRVKTFLVPPRWLFCRIETDEGLGGPVRHLVRVYAWVGGDEPAQLADEIAAQADAGFTAVKMNACGRISPIATAAEVDAVVRRAAIAREALGADRDLAIDGHGRLTPATARRVLPELAPVPALVHGGTGPARAPPRPGVPGRGEPGAAGDGERIYGRAGFLPVLQAGIAVVQPDLSHAGGISEVTRIASLAETFGALLAPHCPLGPIALAASLQVGFATPNLLIQEQSLGIHYNKDADLLSYVIDPEPFRFVAGHAVRGGLPGLGATVDEDAVRAADRDAHRWRNPVWRHHDGSLAEW